MAAWSTFSPGIILLIMLPPLIVLRRWITRHLQGLGFLLWGQSDVAMILYFLVMVPGIVLHELSHWLFAQILGVKTGKMEIWPSRSGQGRIRLGSVRVGRADSFRASVIGLAPFITGCLVIYLIGDFILGATYIIDPLLRGDFAVFQNNLSGFVPAADFYIWLYIVFAVSNTMFPSEADRESWQPVLITLAVIIAVGFLLGLDSDMPPAVTGVFLDLVRYLAYAFTLTVAVNIIFTVVIALLEKLVGSVKGERVEYG
jgi:hypothetical protein